MIQLPLFDDHQAETAPEGFTADELQALRTARLEVQIRELADQEFFAARDAVKQYGIRPSEWPLFRFFHSKLVCAKALAEVSA